MSNLPIEVRYEDVLQNLEAMIGRPYRQHPDELLDIDVEFVVSKLVNHYQAELRGRNPVPVNMNAKRQQLYDDLLAVSEWRLGRSAAPIGGYEIPEPIPLGDLVLCLKRIRKSIKRWTKEGGRQGYLQFVTQFV